MPKTDSKETTSTRKGDKRQQKSERQAAYFLSLTLQNVRCFGAEPQTLDLSDGKGRPARWTILLGNNGTGKTTVLQALVAFEPIAARVVKDESAGDAEFRRYPRGFFFKSGFVRVNAQEAKITATIANGANLNASTEQFYRGECVLSIRDYLSESTRSLDPPICYAYGAGRRLSASSFGELQRVDATASLLFDDTNLLNAEEWLLRLDYSAIKESEIQQRQKERRDQVRQLLIDILPDVDDIRFTAPTQDHPNPRVEFQTPYGWVPLNQLGYGYRTLIAWMVDFASRMVERYPDSPDPLAEPAVVLVDEIDLHLHPTWQRKVMGYLTERFPNTQFIATAHSPLIAQAASDANIALLRREGDHVVIDNRGGAIRGWRIDQVLTSDLFGLPTARPPEFDDLLARRKQLLTKPHLTKADKRELAELEATIGTLPDGETAAEAERLSLIESTLQLLKSKIGDEK